jgi:hypothetical protein
VRQRAPYSIVAIYAGKAFSQRQSSNRTRSWVLEKHTSFATLKIRPPEVTTVGRLRRMKALASPRTINTVDGTIPKKILSNLIVKSKLSRHPRTAGPKEESSAQAEKTMIVTAVRNTL